MPEENAAGGESTLTVLVALGANALNAVLKLVAGVLTGSAAMLAEAAHSVADTATEGLLPTALRRSEKPADRRHLLAAGRAAGTAAPIPIMIEVSRMSARSRGR